MIISKQIQKEKSQQTYIDMGIPSEQSALAGGCRVTYYADSINTVCLKYNK